MDILTLIVVGLVVAAIIFVAKKGLLVTFSEVASGIISLGLLSMGVLGLFVQEFIFGSGAIALCGATLYLSFFKVPNVFVAVPSSYFTGRIKRESDEQGFSIPIRKPYKEGLHFKPFWWRVELVSTAAKELSFNDQEYQIGSGGTIMISGRIQYRVSSVAAYRSAEVGENEVRGGLNSEVDQYIIKRLGEMDIPPDVSSGDRFEQVLQTGIELVIKSRLQISKGLQDRFKSVLINESGDSRILFGRKINYSEHRYGIEVTTAMIDKIDPVTEIKQERDRIQKERYQKTSETIQIDHFNERVRDVLKAFEKEGESITPQEAIEIVQLNMKLTTKEIKEFKGDAIASMVAKILDKK